MSYLSNIYKMSGHVVSDIETRVEGFFNHKFSDTYIILP